jgi:hypothetical protein
MIDTMLPFRTGAGLGPGEPREVGRLLGEGLLVPVLLDVVVAADAPADRDLRARALRLVVPDRLHACGAVVAQRAAAWLWCGGAPPTQVDVAVPPGRGRVLAASRLVRHERRMPPQDVAVITPPGGQGLAVTTGARTAADLLRTLPEATALEAAVHVATATGASPGEVAGCLELMPRARGVARARRLLTTWPEGHSPTGHTLVSERTKSSP